MPSLLIRLQDGQERTVPLVAPSLILGRAPDVDIPLPEVKRLSRQHLRITNVAGVVTVEDLQSANGTFFNGERITRRRMEDGDTLLAGDIDLIFRYDQGEAAPPGLGQAQEVQPGANLDTYVLITGPEYPEAGSAVQLKGTFSIGRAATNTLTLPEKRISGKHAILESLPGGGWCLRDLGSANGTRIDGKPVGAEPVTLNTDDSIEIGSYRLRFIGPDFEEKETTPEAVEERTRHRPKTPASARGYFLLFIEGPLANTKIELGETVSIGRDPRNTLTLAGNKVSKYHAEIVLTAQGFVLRDLNSTNGTHINGRRLSGETRLAHQDILTVGEHVMAFQVPGELLDLDGRIARIRQRAKEKMVWTLLQSIAVLAVVYLLLFFIADKAREALGGGEVVRSAASKEMQMAATLPNLAAALSFEFDPESPDKLPGWDLDAYGRTYQIGYGVGDADDPLFLGGRNSLEIIPDTPAGDPRTQIVLTTNADTDAGLAALTRGTEGFAVTVFARPYSFHGALSLQVVLHRAGSVETRTVAWVAGNELDDAAWQSALTATVRTPADVDRTSLRIVCRGEFAQLYLDEVLVQPARAETPDTVMPPADLPPLAWQWESGLGATLSKNGADVAWEVLPVVLSRYGDGWRVAGSLLDDGPYSVTRASTGSRLALDGGLYWPGDKRTRRAEWSFVRQNLWYQMPMVLRPGLSETPLAEADLLATRVVIPTPRAQGGGVFQAWAANGDRLDITPEGTAGEAAMLTDVAELVWGTVGDTTAVEMTPPGRIAVLREGASLQLFFILADATTTTAPATLLWRQGSRLELVAANTLWDRGRELETTASTQGEALLVYRTGARQYSHLPVGGRFAERRDRLEQVYTELLNDARDAYLALQGNRRVSPVTLGTAQRGLEACASFLARFSVFFEEAQQVEVWQRSLTSAHERIQAELTTQDHEAREDAANRLLARAQSMFNEATPERSASTLQAWMFAEAVVNQFPGTEAVPAAQALLRQIAARWEDTEQRDATATEALENAARLERAGLLEEALHEYRSVLSQYPMHPDRPTIAEAMLRLRQAICAPMEQQGDAAWYREDRDTARVIYQRILDLWPTHPRAAELRTRMRG